MLFRFALAVDEKMNKNNGYKNVTLCSAVELAFTREVPRRANEFAEIAHMLFKAYCVALLHPAKCF